MNNSVSGRLTLAEVAQELGVWRSTVDRWHTRGVSGVKLETFRIGGKRYTTREAIREFNERVEDKSQR